MRVGYARVSTTSQNLDMQVSALTDAGCDKIYTENLKTQHFDKRVVDELEEYILKL